MAVIDKLLARLTEVYNTESTSNVYKLLDIDAEQLEGLQQELLDVMESHFVDVASGIQLDRIGFLLNTVRKVGEADSSYRARLKSVVQGIIGGGTKPQLALIIKAAIPTITDSDIIFEEPLISGEYGNLRILIKNTSGKVYSPSYIDDIYRFKAAGVDLKYVGALFEDGVEFAESLVYSLSSLYEEQMIFSESFSGLLQGFGNFAEGIILTEDPDVGMHRVNITFVNSLNVTGS